MLAEGPGDSAEGTAPARRAGLPFQSADGCHAQPGPLGQSFLRQATLPAQPPTVEDEGLRLGPAGDCGDGLRAGAVLAGGHPHSNQTVHPAWSSPVRPRPELTEANFWRPGGGNAFRALQPGEPFFFKSHYPQNQIVGGGFYSGFVSMRVSEAWELLGPGNGAPGLAELRDQIGRYRKAPIRTGEDPNIGCLLLRDVRFFPDAAVPPPGFAANIVQGKGYDLADSAVASYFGELLQRLIAGPVELDLAEPWHRPGPVFGDPRLAPYRLGQQAFKAVVLDAYRRQCAITGTHIPPVLQAAHVRPIAEGGEHRLDNGLLLRSDVHTMFDRGYLGVDPKYRLVVSPRLRGEFGNGEQFYANAGQVIELPRRRADRPNREFLEWHLSEVFKAS